MKRLFTIGLFAVLSAAATGCIAVGGSDRCESKEPTLGRELQDLKTARDTGAISPDEYERTKSSLIAAAHDRE